MPMLVLTGEKASGAFLIAQGRLVATNVEGVVIPGAGHFFDDQLDQLKHVITEWITEQQPQKGT